MDVEAGVLVRVALRPDPGRTSGWVAELDGAPHRWTEVIRTGDGVKVALDRPALSILAAAGAVGGPVLLRVAGDPAVQWECVLPSVFPELGGVLVVLDKPGRPLWLPPAPRVRAAFTVVEACRAVLDLIGMDAVVRCTAEPAPAVYDLLVTDRPLDLPARLAVRVTRPGSAVREGAGHPGARTEVRLDAVPGWQGALRALVEATTVGAGLPAGAAAAAALVGPAALRVLTGPEALNDDLTESAPPPDEPGFGWF